MGIFLMFVGWFILIIICRTMSSRAPKKKGLLPHKDLRPEGNLLERMMKKVPNGFIFGKDVFEHDWLVKPETIDGHILIVGGSGSGKTSCLAIPSVQSWKNRIFAIDIKGELYAKTNRPVAKVFNPLNPNACGYDPFYILKRSHNEAQEIRKIAICLVPIPAGSRDNFWLRSAQGLLTAGLIHFYNCGLSFIESIYKIQSTPVQTLVNGLAKSEADEARLLANQFVNANPKELASVYSELSNHIIDFVLDRDIRDAFSKPTAQNIKPIDLERGSDIFLQIPEHKLNQWGPILSLITSQFLDHFEKRDETTAKPILFLLDEFPRLGKFDTISDGLATLRSKKITICLIIQSLAQLDYIYGKPQRQIIADNCQFKAVLNATDAETQDYFSKLVGTALQMRETHSTSSNPVGRIEDQDGLLGKYTGYQQYTTTQSSSTSVSYYRDRVIQPHEFASLQDIVLLTPAGFYRAEKTPYYDPKIQKELEFSEKELQAREETAEDEIARIARENEEIDQENARRIKFNKGVFAEQKRIHRKVVATAIIGFFLIMFTCFEIDYQLRPYMYRPIGTHMFTYFVPSNWFEIERNSSSISWGHNINPNT